LTDKQKTSDEKELGFGKQNSSNFRFLREDGSINTLRKGLPFFRPYDAYHALVSISWLKFIALTFFGFVLINLIFALLYMFVGLGEITGTHKSWELAFADAYFFSVQTITTVGYGYYSPTGVVSGIVSSVESFVGLLGFALVTGLLYGRFSRPVAKVRFANKAVIAPYQGGKAFMFKMANQRSSQLIEAEVNLIVTGSDSETGSRWYRQLDVEVEKINFFALSWTVVHAMRDESPIKDWSQEDFKNNDAEFIILMKAFDESFAQTVYARKSYKCSEVQWGKKYISSIHQHEDGRLAIDLDELDRIEEAPVK
jgi:inward rectifier potassium channel